MIMFYRNLSKLIKFSSFNHCKSLLINVRHQSSILSANYLCNNEWSKRLEQDETLKHISTERYFFELNQKYQQRKSVSSIDIDIFINSLQHSESNFIELEHILKKFRKTRETINQLESTNYATCRLYIEQQNKLDDLLKILNNRVEYGIFPDKYINNILLNKFIESKSLPKAFNIVYLMMLQEDSGNQLTKILSFSILNQLLIDNNYDKMNSLLDHVDERFVQNKTDENATNDEEEEIEYIRVPFLTNEFFDDHFDLIDCNHIYGKCLYFFGYEYEQLLRNRSNNGQSNDDELKLAQTSAIIGLIYYEKWEKLQKYLNKSSESPINVTNDLSAVVEKHLNHDKHVDIRRLLSQKTIVDKNSTISSIIESKLLKLIPKLESEDIVEQIQLFNEFQQKRRQILNEQMQKLLLEQKQNDLRLKQQEFEEKKRLYYFFENFSKHEIDFNMAEKRIRELQSKTIVEEDYMPPERY